MNGLLKWRIAFWAWVIIGTVVIWHLLVSR